MTEKLYWKHPTRTTFEATLEGDATATAVTLHRDRPAVVLPCTLFYPEGGGQLGDAGHLVVDGTSIAIVDTQIGKDGTIFHVLGGAEDVERTRAVLAAPRLIVQGFVDAPRRQDHAAQHTAQHALSRAFAEVVGATTVSARLGATICTVDIDRPGLRDGDLHRVEDLVNDVVLADRPVDAFFPTREELAALPLRKEPNADKSADGVRIIRIEDFDVTPCGGTHCTRTGQIGQVRVVAIEKYKGMLRVGFHAGSRALRDARQTAETMRLAGAELTCGPHDVAGSIAKLKASLKAANGDRERLQAEVAELLAAAARASVAETDAAPVVIVMERPAADGLAGLRALANALTRDPRVVALVCARSEEGGELSAVVARGSAAAFDCQAFFRAQGGRGGGRAERAEGKFGAGTTAFALRSALRRTAGLPDCVPD